MNTGDVVVSVKNGSERLWEVMVPEVHDFGIHTYCLLRDNNDDRYKALVSDVRQATEGEIKIYRSSSKPEIKQSRNMRSRKIRKRLPVRQDGISLLNYLSTVECTISVEERESDATKGTFAADYLSVTGKELNTPCAGYSVYKANNGRWGSIVRLKFPEPPEYVSLPNLTSRMGNPVSIVKLADGGAELAHTDFIFELLGTGFVLGRNAPSAKETENEYNKQLLATT
jgi:hypothetical protein